jgi:hypothetical protein
VYSRIIQIVVGVASTAAFAGCATREAAAPGISSDEMRVLVSDYYWKRDLPEPKYTAAQLDALLRASADPTLDGARAEMQASRVAVALASVGDAAFSQALMRQSVSVKRAVAREIVYLWSRHSLHYPKTQALLQPYT